MGWILSHPRFKAISPSPYISVIFCGNGINFYVIEIIFKCCHPIARDTLFLIHSIYQYLYNGTCFYSININWISPPSSCPPSFPWNPLKPMRLPLLRGEREILWVAFLTLHLRGRGDPHFLLSSFPSARCGKLISVAWNGCGYWLFTTCWFNHHDLTCTWNFLSFTNVNLVFFRKFKAENWKLKIIFPVAERRIRTPLCQYLSIST